MQSKWGGESGPERLVCSARGVPFNNVAAPGQEVRLSVPPPSAGYAPERGCRRAWRRRTSYTLRGSEAGRRG